VAVIVAAIVIAVAAVVAAAVAAAVAPRVARALVAGKALKGGELLSSLLLKLCLFIIAYILVA
jgi:hypothetical protein